MNAGIIQALSLLESDPENADALAALAALAEGGGNGHGRGAPEAGDTAIRRALVEARRSHRERGDFELVTRLIDLELGWETDKSKRADLYHEKGRILYEEMLAEAESVAAFQRVLELRPDDAPAQEMLDHIALVRDNWQKILRKYLEEAKTATDRQLEASLYLSAAEVCAKYNPGDRVEQYLKQAVAVDPRNLKAQLRLERLYRSGARHAELAALYAQRLESASVREERIAASLALAELQASRLGRSAEAAETYKKVLTLEPQNSKAMSALVELYTVEENWPALISLYESGLRSRPRGAAAIESRDPESELAIHLQIGMLWWRKLANLASADEYFKRVRKADPSHPAALDFYRALYAHDPVRLLPILQQAQKLADNPERRLALSVEMAGLGERSGASAERAIDLWKAVLKQAPSDPQALDALKRLYHRTEKWNALLELLKESIERLPKDAVGEHVEGLLEVVAIYRDQLGLDVMVINTYNHILQLQPDHRGALEALAEKYEALGRWNDLIHILQRSAETTSDAAEKARTLRRIAALWIEKFGNYNQAVKPLEELYTLEPTSDAAARLREIYARRRSFRALLELERRELDRLEEAPARRTKLIEMAHLAAERLGDSGEAIGLWNRLLELDPFDPDALAQLATLYEREKRYLALIEVLSRQGARAGEPRAQALLLEKIGTLYAERLSAPDRAIEAYRRVLELVPAHPKALRILRELYAQAGRYPELEELYATRGQWEELCETLLGVAERASEPETRLRLYHRVAEIAMHELKSPERAAKAYERILALDAKNRSAAEALLPIYRGAEKWARLLATYEIVLDHVEDQAERLAIHREIRALCEDKLGSKGLAFSWCARAYALKPGDPELERELERLAHEAEAWDELVEIYVRQAERETSTERQVERYRQLAHIALARLYRPEEARRYFEEVLRRSPDDPEALGALEQIFTQAQAFPELLAVYRRREALARDPERQLEVLFKTAWIEEEQVGDLEAAITTYRRILALEPPGPARSRALRALEKLHEKRGDFAGLGEALGLELALVGDDVDARVGLEQQLGEILETRLGRRTEALDHYQAAFALQPAHKPTLAALERYLDAAVPEAERLRVARMLLPVYEQRLSRRLSSRAGEAGREEPTTPGAERRLFEVLEILRAGAADAAERLELERRLRVLATGELANPARAYDYAVEIFVHAPGDQDNRLELARLADLLERLDDFAIRLGEVESAAAARGDLELARDLGWELGQLFESRLSMRDEAEAAYRRVLEHQSDHPGALEQLTQLYSAQERFVDLRGLLKKKKEQAREPAARLELLFSICDLDEGVLDDTTAAERDYLEVLELDPASTRAFRALERLYTTAERFQDLDRLLERRAPFLGGEAGAGEARISESAAAQTRAQLKFRRGELHMTRLESPERAADLFEEALAEDPLHEPSRKGLEALMKRPDLRQRIARTLEPLYNAEEAWSKLALALSAQREAADGAEAVALLERLAALQEEKLGARQLALGTWREALRLEPSSARADGNVERLARLLERPADLAAAWEEALASAAPTDLGLRARLLGKLAHLYQDDLIELERAQDAYRRLLELDPTNLETARPAAAALARLYDSAGSWPFLVDVLRLQADWAETGEERRALMLRIATIEEELMERAEAAIATFREILESEPEERQALSALERLYAAERKWPELVEILRRRVELSQDSSERRELLWRVAQLHLEELADADAAIAGYHAVLDENADDIPALEALAELYQSAERRADLLEILERRLELALGRGDPARTRLRLRLAELLGDMGRHDQALERYREILEEEPRHDGARRGLEALLDQPELKLRAAEVLEPHYLSTGETEKLVALSELWAAHAPDPRERIVRLRRIAELKEKMGDAEAAFDALGRAARLAVGEPELPALLDTVDRQVQGPLRARRVSLYRELGGGVLDAAVQERVYLTIADESQKLGDVETAREYYRRILDGASDHARALDALESLYLEARDFEPLLEIYLRRAELAGADEERRRHYLMQTAQLCERELDRPDQAIAAYEQVLELFPADVEASRALEQRYLAGRRHLDLANLLEQRLGFADDIEEAVALRFRLATLFDEDLLDTGRAVENYRAALGGDPGHAGAIAALERYLEDDAHRVSAAEVLEPVYTARHDWPRLVRIYQIRLDAADDPRARLGLTRRIARLYEEQLEDLDGALTWFGKVFREDPGDRAVRDQLARLAGILDGWDRLARLYEEYLSDTLGETSHATAEVMRALAVIYDERLKDVERARSSYEKLLEAEPGDEHAFLSLEDLLTRSQRWDQLLESYRGAAERALDGERRKLLLFKQATIVEEQLGDADRAIELYRGVLDLAGDEGRAISALERLYTRELRWHDLVELTIKQLENAEGSAWVALKLRLGAIYENELEDRPAAIDAYQEVLEREAEQPEAVRALERLIVDHDHTYRIAQILEPIYRQQDAWQKLVVIYEAEQEFIEDRGRRVELLEAIARLHRERGSGGQLAFRALGRAWSEEAEDPDQATHETALYQQLSELAGELGAWAELERLLETAVEKSYDDELRARVHARVAEIRESRLGDVAGAVASWRKVVGVRADSDEAWRALERLIAAGGTPEELVPVLLRRAELATDSAEQKALLERVAKLQEEQLGQSDAAIASWRQILDLDDGDRGALDALERLYRRQRAFTELVQVHARQIELAEGPKERRQLHFKIADIAERELSDRFAALDAYKAVLEAEPKDREALEAVARLYQLEGLWPDQVEALDARAEIAGDPTERIGLEFEAARVLDEKMGDAEAAIGRYHRILGGEPGHAGARQRLEKLLRDESTREAAAQVLEPFYQERGDFQALLDLAELKLSSEADPFKRRVLLERIAELNEAGVEDMQAAFAAWARVLAEDPGDEAAQAELERLSELGGAQAELARIYEERLEASFDPEVQRALAMKLGRLYEHKVGDEERAIVAYRRALDLPGDERPLLEALDRLLERAHRPGELAEVLAEEARAAGDPAEQARYLERLGDLRLGELVDLDGALGAYRDALERQPGLGGARAGLERLLSSPAHTEAALDLLEPLFEADGDVEKAFELGEVRLGLLPVAAEKAGLLERLAERAERELQDFGRALAFVARALELCPDERRLLDELERVGKLAEQELIAADVYEQLLSKGGLTADCARELGLRAGRLWLKLDDAFRAETRYLAVLELDGDNGEALEALETVYRQRHDLARLAAILVRRADLELDAALKKRLLEEAARLEQGPLAADDRAAEIWRKLMELGDGEGEGEGVAVDALAEIYERRERFAELAEILEHKAQKSGDPAAKLEVLARLGAVYASKLGELDRAADSYRQMLDLEPRSALALDALEQLEASRGDFAAVREVLVRKLDAAASDAARASLFRQLARIAEEKQAAPEEAVGYLREVIELQPGDVEATAELGRLLEKTEKWHELIDLVSQRAAQARQAGDAGAEVQLLMQAARVWSERLESPESARDLLEQVLDRDAGNVAVLLQLADLYQAAGERERLQTTLERAVALVPAGKEAAELEFRLGVLAREAAGDAAAEPHFHRALKGEPTHAGAQAALAELLAARGAWDELAELLEARVELAPEKDRGRLLTELARLQADKLLRPDAATRSLERARELLPDDSAVAESLADLYFAGGRLDEALPLYRWLVDKIGKARRTRELGRLRFRIGSIAEKRGDNKLALEEYSAAHQIDATHAPTLVSLGRIHMIGGDWEKARRIYRSMLLQNLDPAAGVTKADIYLHLGEIHEHLGELPKAIGMYERGLEIDGTHSSLKQAMARVKPAAP